MPEVVSDEVGLLKRLAPWMTFMISVLTAATLYVGMGGPVPTMNTDLAALESRIAAQIQKVEDRATGLERLVLSNDLISIQREIGALAERIREEGRSPARSRLMETLTDKERALKSRLNDLSREKGG
jgi:hypothetical protein